MSWDPLSRLNETQRDQLRAFELHLREMNRRINLISRADEDHVFEHHILHALALTRRGFPPAAHVVDWGSGGGLPAIPLAIAFPDVRFTAVDAVGKKMHAVRTMARRLDLQNLTAWHGRAEEFPEPIQYSVSRATAPLETLWAWHLRAFHPAEKNSGGSFRAAPDPDAVHVTSCWDAGLICLKGGDLDEEIRQLTSADPDAESAVHPLDALFSSSYFDQKVIVTVRRPG